MSAVQPPCTTRRGSSRGTLRAEVAAPLRRRGPFAFSPPSLLEAGVRGKLASEWTGELLRRQVLGDENVPGYPTRTSAGLVWEFRPGQRAVFRHEIESGDGPTRDRTLLGLESRLGRYTRSFANYALQQGANGALLRSTTRESLSTSLLNVEPAPVVAPRPILIGATSSLPEPMNTSSSISVWCLLAPS